MFDVSQFTIIMSCIVITFNTFKLSSSNNPFVNDSISNQEFTME